MIKGISRGLLSLALAGLLATVPQGASSAAAQDDFTTGALLQRCTAEDHFTEMACVSVIRGFDGGVWAVLSVAELLDVDLKRSQWAYCPPDGVTIGQMQSIFVKWARENPTMWHTPYGVGIIRSQQEAFPCH